MAFENAGQEPGIQVWRIEDFEAVAYDNIGNFHVGDSYIVLKVNLFSFLHFILKNIFFP